MYKFGNRTYDLSSRTFIMGILNITPDSFSDGGKYFNGIPDTDKAAADALQMIKDGADFIDIGGESTRPGSESITADEELCRIIPVIKAVSKATDIPISVDTYKSEVAEEALKEGACIVNDISGFTFDKKLPSVTAKYNASCILMHIKGTPKNMQKDPVYSDVTKEVINFLQSSVKSAFDSGINQIILDPGIGFGKSLDNNMTLIRELHKIKILGYPVLLGTSRKSFIDKIFASPSEERLEGTIASNVIGIMNGADILRVHDVKENYKAAVIADRILNRKSELKNISNEQQ
ncbi:MAG TPA: dihydropteroate synthase [Ignavibacteria bacterium]|nr:dihydropteroate synthase [Ignavibacteria bacterium]HRJ99704.1 dihydropteroate synthase [Ignavibacteria bacterium]